jgi:hypothetical protein
MNHIIAELFGYLAFILLAISLMVNNDIKFRWINGAGSLSFVLYGLFINAMPVVITNGTLLIINAYQLVRIYRNQEYFDAVVFRPGDEMIGKFLTFYQKDIHQYFPDFNIEENENDLRFVVLRDTVIANIFVAQTDAKGNAYVKINYTVPKYRDYKVGRFLFDKGNNFLLSKGLKKIVYKKVHHRQHERFLNIMGFEKQEIDGALCYAKNLA